MAYVVTDSCILCKFTECVMVCPVNCFHEGENMLVIDPDQCIDCGMCEPECPTRAIHPEGELDYVRDKFIKINRDYSQVWPVIHNSQERMPTADAYQDVTGKADRFSPNPGPGN